MPRSGWIISPLADLLLFANVSWLVLLVVALTHPSDSPVEFWVIYYLTVPHRWITLVLVATDPDRRAGRQGQMLAVAGLAAVGVGGVFLGTGELLCLAAIDYVWNAWHFASQHAGVLRIYGRKCGGGWAGLERWGMRLFITYVALRAAGWTTGWLETNQLFPSGLGWSDMAVLTLPLVLLGSQLPQLTAAHIGKLVYLSSVCGLYSGFLLSLHYRWTPGIIALATAASLFHAVEYLTLVTHYARQRRTIGSDGTFRRLAQGWLTFLAVFVLSLGSIGVYLTDPANGWNTAWLGINLWAAFLHYAYDGMIWKLRQPATAAALGAY